MKAYMCLSEVKVLKDYLEKETYIVLCSQLQECEKLCHVSTEPKIFMNTQYI